MIKYSDTTLTQKKTTHIAIPTPILHRHRSHRRISPVGDLRAVETVCRVYVVTFSCVLVCVSTVVRVLCAALYLSSAVNENVWPTRL